MKDYWARMPQAKVAFEQIPYAKPELTTYEASRMWRILNDNIQSAVTGEATAAQAMRNAQEQADEVLKKYQ
jgi:sn-glycerol 3-phosphate transport system substrate-binding protein